MKLPLRDFVDVVHGIEALAKKGARPDGRDASRITVSASIKLHQIENERIAHSHSALTSEISLSGIGLFQSTTLPLGCQVILALPLREQTLSIAAVVVRSAELADGVYATGLEFVRVVDEQTMQQLLPSTAPVAAATKAPASTGDKTPEKKP